MEFQFKTTDDATGISSKSVIDWNHNLKYWFKTKNYIKRWER